MKKQSIHSGHRRRVREKFIASDFEHFNDHEILELMLFYTIPMRDTNPIAHELLNHFGSISAVFDASYEELRQFGLPEKSAVLMNSIPVICHNYMKDRNFNLRKRYDENQLKTRLIAYSLKKQKPVHIYAFFDAMETELFFGTLPYTEGERIVENLCNLAMKYNAATMILCTSTTSGIAYPTPEDMGLFSMISDSLNGIHIHIKEWYIVSGTRIENLSDHSDFKHMFAE